MAQIKVRKSTGEKEPLKVGKIISTLKRAGADDKTAESIAYNIESRAKSGISTHDIYQMALRQLRRNHPALAARYSLRDAIFRLGPAGFEFEKYIMLLFRAYGYKAHLPEILEGKCITHEVDVLAKKDNKTIIMECKLRHSTSIFISIKDTMSTWARYMDLRDGARLGKCPMPDEVWIVTNSRFSHDSQQYGECKKMGMLSWDSPSERPLPAWIDKKKLYPVTVLQNFSHSFLGAFSKAEILLLRDLVKYDVNSLARKTRINKKKLNNILEEAKQVLKFEPNNN